MNKIFMVTRGIGINNLCFITCRTTLLRSMLSTLFVIKALYRKELKNGHNNNYFPKFFVKISYLIAILLYIILQQLLMQ